MMILHRLFSIPAQIAFPQSRQTNFHIFSKRKRGTRLSSQKDRCRRNGLNTGFFGPLFIFLALVERLSPRVLSVGTGPRAGWGLRLGSP